MKNIENILEIARIVGWEAGDILRSYYHQTPEKSNLDVQYKQNEPVTIADVAVNQHIVDRLQDAFGTQDYAYMSEETYKLNSGKQFAYSLVWIIDPLDGTRDFIEKTGEYAVHIALTKEGRPILSVVAVPEQEKLYYAIKGEGAFAETRQAGGVNNAKRLQVSTTDVVEDLTVVVSRSHRDDRFKQMLQNLSCQKQKAVGSVGCKIATIVEQQADVYISLSGKSAPKDWDMAAPELILTEAGGQFTYVDGKPLQYNTGDVNQWGALIATNGRCHEELCQQIAQVLAEIDSKKA